MTTDRHLFGLFCDDIRQEVGNKLSLMGCYGPDLVVDALPAVLPRLCVQIRLVTPKARPCERAVIRLFMNDDDLLGELEIPVAEMNKQITNSDETTRLTYMSIMTFTPFAFEKEGVLRLEAETETGVIRGSRLRLKRRGEAVPTTAD